MLQSGLVSYKDRDRLFSYWIITRKCNYTCQYCVCPKLPQNEFDSSRGTIDRVIEVYNHLETLKPVDLIISGGEPTIKDLPYIFTHLKVIQPITLFTNLSQSADYYLGLNKIHPLKLYVSYHPTQTNFQIFIKKLNYLYKYITITAKFMIPKPSSILLAYKVQKEVSKDVATEFHVIGKATKAIHDQLIQLNRNIEFFYGDKELSLYELFTKNNFKGWECTAPGNALCIDYAGKVYTCKAHFQKKKPLPFTVFDNFEEEYAKLPKTTICPLNRCTSELEVLKYKEEH